MKAFPGFSLSTRGIWFVEKNGFEPHLLEAHADRGSLEKITQGLLVKGGIPPRLR